jgi:Tol biopolymer transport system component
MRVKLNSNGEVESDPDMILSFSGKSVSGVSMARDGTAVLSLNEGSTNLFAVDVDAGVAITIPVQLTSDDVLNTLPDYGPHGRIAYEQQVVGRPIAAWLMDDDGNNKEPLSAGLSVSVQAPQWDGQATRVFADVTEPGSARSYFAWIDLATRQLREIPTPPFRPRAGSPPHLSPDDRQLAFHVIGADGVMNIWVQHLDSGTERQITFDREAMAYPRWSQDGNWLGVVTKRGEHTHIGVVSADGGAIEQLTLDQGQSRSTSFSPDNDWIAFAGERGGVWNIYTVSRRTKEVNQLTHFTTTDHVLYPAWSPRGSRIVFERSERKASLWTLRLPC